MTMFLFTTDKNNQEEIFDLVLHFTTFFIIFLIDNMLIGFADLSGYDLELEWKKDSAQQKFERYYKFKRKLENIPEKHALINTIDTMMSVMYFGCFITMIVLVLAICVGLGVPT